MRRFLRFGVLVLATAGAVWGYQNNAIQSWEYAVVNNWSSSSGSQTLEGDHSRVEFHGRATICYFQKSGCRAEEVQVTSYFVDYTGKEHANHFGDAQQAAVAKAAALLGSAGWELVGNGPDLTWQTNSNRELTIPPALYFKRVTRSSVRNSR